MFDTLRLVADKDLHNRMRLLIHRKRYEWDHGIFNTGMWLTSDPRLDVDVGINDNLDAVKKLKDFEEAIGAAEQCLVLPKPVKESNKRLAISLVEGTK